MSVRLHGRVFGEFQVLAKKPLEGTEPFCLDFVHVLGAQAVGEQLVRGLGQSSGPIVSVEVSWWSGKAGTSRPVVFPSVAGWHCQSVLPALLKAGDELTDTLGPSKAWSAVDGGLGKSERFGGGLDSQALQMLPGLFRLLLQEGLICQVQGAAIGVGVLCTACPCHWSRCFVHCLSMPFSPGAFRALLHPISTPGQSFPS